ncbi:MAG: ATP-binding protein [Ignavibacteriales bacterium]
MEGQRKYFSVFYAAVLIILGIGIISPVIIEKRQQNWAEELNNVVSSMESSVVSYIKAEQAKVLNDNVKLQNSIRDLLGQKKIPLNKLIESINNKAFSGYSVEIFNENEQLIAWTENIAIPEENFFPLNFDPGEIHFFRSGLFAYLSITDTISAGGKTFYEAISLPVEKYYHVQNNYYIPVSLSDRFSQKYLTSFEADYSPAARITTDGRKYSIVIESNKNKPIGVVTFLKPSREENLANLKELFFNLQSVFAIIGVIALLLGFYKDVKKFRSQLLKTTVVILFLALVRFLLFFLEFPAKFLEGPLTNSSYFASSFGAGIVKSPLEFFITVVFALIICIDVFNSIWSNVKEKSNGSGQESRNYMLYGILLILSAALYLIFLRGLGASVKSAVFDSSLRYFREPGLLPDFPAGLMQFNVLLLGIGSVLISLSIIMIMIYYYPAKDNKGIKKGFLVLFLLFQVFGLIFDLIQVDPQGTHLIRLLYITFTFLLAYKIYFEQGKVLYNYVYFALVASVISISMLNFYNSRLERESLKTTTYELTRTNDDWLEFLIREALMNAVRDNEAIDALKEQKTNFETAAFSIWSQSSLQREAMRSAITFLDKEKRILGSFGVDLKPMYRINPMVLNYEGEEMRVFNNYTPEQLNGKIVSGIIPIKEDNVVLGYVVASLMYNPNKYRANSLPPFLSSSFNSINSIVNFENLKIFDFINNKLINVFGDITPADWHTENIVNADFHDNEAWITLNINNENYTTYIFREIKEDNTRILAVALKEKNLSWSLYNFFKIFFIHSIFIIVLLLFIYFLQVNKTGFAKYTFRTQLLAAFLFISLLPLLFMAFYNRNLTAEKNKDIILLKLAQNSSNIESYVKDHLLSDKNRPVRVVFAEASRDLSLDFEIYSDKRLIYSSKEEYYRAGILPEIIDPVIYDRLTYQGFKEFAMTESVEAFRYNSFYNKVIFDGREYTLKVTDLFNRMPLPITGEEIDIFLFGSYFFATFLVIIISTLLANRISSPIRELTKATSSVANGDLSFEIRNTQKGEIRDLINGFNSMIKELKRSQNEIAQMERESAWKEMARQVAHEIKNPLTPMKLAVQHLIIAYKDKSPKFDAIFDKVSKTIIGQIDTLSNIASEFSSFARMPNIKMEKFDLAAIVHEACDLYVDENVKIGINIAEEPLIMEADRDQLKRTIINLIRNSVQAGATIVSLNAFATAENINLEIVDNGRGIPEEMLSRVFEPNFTTKKRGMGLGLKIAKKFMEGISGNIDIVESTENGTKILLQFIKIK